MLVTNLTSGRVVAAIMTMGLLSATIPVWDARDWPGVASAMARGGGLAVPDRERPAR